ncbi:MAG: aldehyde dehydrogenase family protein [Chloroflexi bacterium]|nr:aldehyde dehydrogenase family protein [Chloroflexota bacterium]MCI0644898.1 aldehyde dehydrogenase family protein [Chloroflexota bacterium]MCI0731272.1 aldehyde dehydrogenase family protein [Chloroflexota bacterium]
MADMTAIAQTELGEYGVLINGKQHKTGDAIEVRSPYDDALVAVVHRGGPDEVEMAIQAAVSAFTETRQLPSWKRTEILEKISAGIEARHEEFARTIALEAGKPIRTARAEVDRAVFTFKVAAEEARRLYGEIVPLDWLPGTEGRTGFIQRMPRGPIVGITPFNFPLNLVAHKVAPALAAGNPVIIRPASQTPVASFKLAEVVLAAGWPAGGMAVVPCSTSDAGPLVEDDRIKLLTFTGSPAVGWALKRRAGRKPVTLELGGNAGTIVHDDADLDYAATRVNWGAYSYAGQSCISVQRVYIHSQVYENFVDDLIPKVEALRTGNPLNEDTDVGPLIDKGAADRLAEWLEEAKAGGAHVLTGGEREGNIWRPTVLASIQEEMRISCQEAFGPFVGLYQYTDVMEAIRRVDASDFGLQAGLFTNDWNLIQRAFKEIGVGGLMVNDVSTFRVDHMPYGGVKASGFGREGLRYAIEEMTEMKLLMVHQRDGTS